MKIQKITTSLRLSETVHRQVVDLSQRKQQHVSTLLREAITAFLRSQSASTS